MENEVGGVLDTPSEIWTMVESLIFDLKHIWQSNVVELFIDQDDFLIEALLCLANLHTRNQGSFSRYKCPSDVDPFMLFLSLLDRTGWNYSLLLDFVMSPETCFLLYLVKMLKHMSMEWDHWIDACESYQCVHKETTCTKKHIGRKKLAGPRSVLIDSGIDHSDVTSEDQDSVVDGRSFVSSGLPVPVSCKCENNRSNSQTTDHVISASCAVVDYSSSSSEEAENALVERTGPNQPRQVDCEIVKKKRRIEQDIDSDHREIAPENDDRNTSESVDSHKYNLIAMSSYHGADKRLTLVQAMTVLIELQRVVTKLIAKDMFPFNVQPLVRHLRRCETLFYDTRTRWCRQ